MKIKVIASGSKGNCTYIECGNKKFLIDVGINYLQIQNALRDINVDVKDIDFVLITHNHNDHIKGLGAFLKKTEAVLYAPTKIYENLCKTIEIKNYHVFEKFIEIDNIEINSFSLSHDVECYGFLIKFDGKELVYITDTGYLNNRYFDLLSNKDVYIIESNHDEKMLMDGPYPYILKQRIISDRGHLSNSTTGLILRKIVGKRTKFVFLAHISEHNNTKEIALEKVVEKLKEIDFDESKIIITDQYIPLDMIEV